MVLRAEHREIDSSTIAVEIVAPASFPTESDPEGPPVAANEQRPFQDAPTWIWKLFFASWIGFFATLVMIFAVSSNVAFILGVVATFAAVFFLTPLVLLRMTRRTKSRNLRLHIGVGGGQCSDVEAATQIVLLPIVLTIGLIVIGMFIPR